MEKEIGRKLVRWWGADFKAAPQRGERKTDASNDDKRALLAREPCLSAPLRCPALPCPELPRPPSLPWLSSVSGTATHRKFRNSLDDLTSHRLTPGPSSGDLN
ncbi:hypothetical protein Mapa_013938 [Marchantia paleacea]|nr:hypothetical protein Mapa_013938 [Marchantia paleacea]